MIKSIFTWIKAVESLTFAIRALCIGVSSATERITLTRLGRSKGNQSKERDP